MWQDAGLFAAMVASTDAVAVAALLKKGELLPALMHPLPLLMLLVQPMHLSGIGCQALTHVAGLSGYCKLLAGTGDEDCMQPSTEAYSMLGVPDVG